MLRHRDILATDGLALERQRAAIGKELCELQMAIDRHLAELPVGERAVEMARIHGTFPTFARLKCSYRFLYPDRTITGM